MKKYLLSLIAVLFTAVAAIAADMTTVWDNIKNDKMFIYAPVEDKIAAKNGFEKLYVLLNSDPSSSQIQYINKMMGTIDAKQRLTSVTREGVNVTIYAAPYNVSGSEYKLMIFMTKDNDSVRSLIVLYGICDSQGIQRALTNLSIEDIIGG